MLPVPRIPIVLDTKATVGGPMPTNRFPSETHVDYLADCRTRLALDLLANTWNGVVVWALRHGPQRPVALRKRIGGISAKALNETLRRLEHHGLVARQAYREAPPRVEYHLT